MLKIFIVMVLALYMPTGNAHEASMRNPSQHIVTNTIADQPSEYYRFVTYYLDSDDGDRHYRVQIGIPLKPAPKSGYKAIYMLDGNAAIATLTQADVLKLNQNDPTVIVAIGYDVDTRNDPVARAYDYTPPVYENGNRVINPVVLDKSGGGADEFLVLLQNKIIPFVDTQVSIDKQKTVFWGHSYGGLFVLYTLTEQPDLFNSYVAADPSVWWYNGTFEQTWLNFDKSKLPAKKIAILTGTKPLNRAAPYEIDAANHKDRPYKNPALILHDIIFDLAANQAALDYKTYPGAGHGDMIRLSLEYVLESVLSD